MIHYSGRAAGPSVPAALWAGALVGAFSSPLLWRSFLVDVRKCRHKGKRPEVLHSRPAEFARGTRNSTEPRAKRKQVHRRRRGVSAEPK
jgi:hypothetical protein